MTLEQALTQRYGVCGISCAEEKCVTPQGLRTTHVAAIHRGIHGKLCATILVTSAVTAGWVIWGDLLLCPKCWRRGRRQIEVQVSRTRGPAKKALIEHLQNMLDAERASRSRYTVIPIERPN